MKRNLLLALAIATVSFASAKDHHRIKRSYQDRDMDGVIDKYDRCPHTPFFAIVNKKGCTVKRLHISKEQEKTLRKLLRAKR